MWLLPSYNNKKTQSQTSSKRVLWNIFFSGKISNSLFQKPFIEHCIKIPKLKVICINRERYDYNINYKGQKEFTRRHVSGHAFKPELKELIERINPGKIIPIHTTNLKQFKEIFGAKLFLPTILSQSKYSLFFKSDLSILWADNCY